MRIDGYKAIFEKFIEPLDQDIFFSKIVDRRVTGSMNDLVFQAKIYLSVSKASLIDVSLRLNESPMSYLDYDRPKNEFQRLPAGSGKSSGNDQRMDNVIYINAIRPPTIKS